MVYSWKKIFIVLLEEAECAFCNKDILVNKIVQKIHPSEKRGGFFMKMFKEEGQRQILLACGILLMMGWFSFTTMQMSGVVADSEITRQRVPVLMYHHILPQEEIKGLFADNNIVVSLEQFQSDMQTLKNNGYQTISLRQLNDFVRNGAEVPPKSVVVTFDDGYLSNKIYAMPVLQKLNYTAAIFTLTGWMEEKPQPFDSEKLQYLSWEEIRQMGHTFQFASHTDNLHSLSWNGTGKLLTESSLAKTEDLRRSLRKLHGTTYFSYPYGHYSEEVQQILEQQGIELAFTVNPVSVCAGDNPLELGRWDMYQYTIEEVLKSN